MPVPVRVVQTGLEKSIADGAKAAGRNLKINMGPGAKSIEALSKPLGRLTGKADEFTKSMEAANARVLAFGASVGVISAVTKGMQELVRTTIEVEKSLANINSILKQTDSQLNTFKSTIFDIARNTEQSFATVAEAALELSRQGLKAEEVTKRLNDSLILSRLSGLSAADSVAGLTAAINSFSSAGLTSSEVLNKISAAAASAAVSDRDLIEGLKRSGAVAVAAGVQFDELVGIIGALQERTARGGAVIGNSLKTIFTRIQDLEKLQALQDLGVQVTDFNGKVLSSNKIIENLAPTFAKLDQASKVNLADNLVGKFQIAPFLALLEDYNLKISRSGEIANKSFGAANEAYERNAALNMTLATAINTAQVSLQQLGETLGKIGVTDSLKNILTFFNGLVKNIQEVMDGEGIGSDLAKGIAKGLGAIVTGPGFALIGAVILKLLFDFAKFGMGALKTFFGLNKAAERQASLQGQIAATLLNDKKIRQDILNIENQSISAEEKRRQQAEYFENALREQLSIMQQMQGIAASITPSVMTATAPLRGKKGKNAAGGFLPIGAERSDIARGVGGAPSSAKPVVIPNFAFGGGRRGTMVANTSEYIVPNYANGGDAIFNQNMASSMGLPANARKVRAASGYIPNFAKDVVNSRGRYVMMHGQKGGTNPDAKAYRHPDGRFNMTNGKDATEIRVPTYGLTDNTKAKDVDQYIKKLETYAYDQALKQASDLSNGEMPRPIVKGTIQAHINKGSLAAFAGSIYELALAALLTDEEFLKYASQTDTSNFDLNLQGQDKLLKLYGIKTKPMYGEVKGRNNPDNIASAAAKIYRVLEGGEQAQVSKLVGKKMSHNLAVQLGLKPQGGRRGVYTIKDSDLAKINQSGMQLKTKSGMVTQAASGYIPNFAQGALEDAVGREQAAGLPISQIRINQSGKLRNSQNPMGLAVTNTRDEPTGAIPNFVSPTVSQPYVGKHGGQQMIQGVETNFKALSAASQKAASAVNQQTAATNQQTTSTKEQTQSTKENSKSINDGNNARKDNLGMMFAVSAGLTALSAATSGSESQFGKIANAMASAAASASSYAFAGNAIKDLGSGMTDSKNKLVQSGGKAVKFLGSLGVYAGLAVEGFKLTKFAINEITGENARLAKQTDNVNAALKRMEAASDDLSFAFGLVSKEAGASIKIEAENIVNRRGVSDSPLDMQAQTARKINAIRIENDQQTKFDIDKSGTVRELVKRTFEGGTPEKQEELKKQFQVISGGFMALGKTAEEVDDMLDKFGSNLSAEELIKFQKELGDLTNLIKSGGKKYSEDLQKISLEDLKRMSQAGGGGMTLLSGENLTNEQRKDLQNKEIERRQNLEAEARKRIGLTAAKARVQSAIEIRKIQLDNLSTEEKQLKTAQSLGDVDKQRLESLKTKIAQQDLDKRFAKENLDFLTKQTDELKNFGIEDEKIKTVRNGILNLSLDQLTNIEDIKKETENILKLNGINKDVTNLLVNALSEELIKNQQINEEKKKSLKITTDENEKLAERKAILDRVSSSIALQSARNTITSQESTLSESGRIKGEIRSLNKQLNVGYLDPIVQERLKSDLRFQQKRLAIATGAEQRAGILESARTISVPESLTGMNEYETLATAENPIENLRQLLEFGRKGSTQFGMSDDSLNKFEAEILKLESSLTKNSESTQQNIDALQNLERTLYQQGSDDIGRAKLLYEFSRSEAGDLERLGLAKQEAAIKGGDPELIARRMKMEMGVFDRIGEAIPTALENSNQLSETLKDGSLTFAHNIGNAMLDAIQKGENLGDLLIGVATEFLNTISRAFMKSAVDNLLGSFGIGKQGGGPISGGSGTKDDVPAMLMGGEFVMNKKAVKKYGMGFMSALNNGSIQGFASGGQVRDREGMFMTPGVGGAGSIVGGANLFSFATQSPMALNRDNINAYGGFLGSESGRLTVFGRRNNPEFQRVQEAKRQAFDLYVGEENAKAQARQVAKDRKKQLMNSLKGAVISAGLSYGLSAASTGFSNAFGASKAAGGTFGANFKAGLGGVWSGGGEGNMGGLKNIFSGNFKNAIASSPVNKNSGGLGPHNGPFDENGNYVEAWADRKYATGGLIPQTSGVDTVPAMLSGGEFVMNAAATRNIGAGNLQALNSGANVGDNSDLISKLDELIRTTETSQSTGDINITINGSTGAEETTSQRETSEQQKAFSEKIKVAVKQVIADEQRLGGQLRR